MALWTPEYIDTALWLDAADSSTITESGGAVSVWADKSGNGREFVQITASAKPTYSTSTFDGKPGLSFDGVDDDLYAGDVELHSPGLSVFVVGRFLSDYDIFGKYSAVSNQRQWLIGRTTFNVQEVLTPYNKNTVAIISSPGDISAILCGVYSPGVAVPFYVNGSVAATAATAVSTIENGSENLRIGKASGFNYSSAVVSEIVALSSAIDTDTRQLIEGYLAHKWGLETNLPSDHPYKSAAPTVPSLTGIIRDRFGNPCQRKVYAVSRPTDTTAPQILAHGLSDATTGAYELILSTEEEVTRVVVAEDEGTPGPNDPVLPDLAHRIIPT